MYLGEEQNTHEPSPYAWHARSMLGEDFVELKNAKMLISQHFRIFLN